MEQIESTINQPITLITDDGTMLEEAMRYLDLGWSIIPLEPGRKQPLVSWKEFQHKGADRDQIVKWWKEWPNANIGVVTGKISNLVVFDLDSEEARLHFQELGGFPCTGHLFVSQNGG